MPIGAKEQTNGVYYYNGVALRSQSNAVREGDLWHNRMGHPSKEIMKNFGAYLGFPVHSSKDNNL